jgi:hypothetical protein
MASSIRLEAPAGSFIVNLCALPSPQRPPQRLMAEWPDLQFFVSRRGAAGAERFYLHAGFFPTRAESEHWRNIFRSRYPNAFVSQLGSRAAADTPDPDVLSETQTLRVLEVRPPRRDDSRDEHAETGFYAVIPEPPRQPPQEPLTIATTAARSLPQPAPVSTAATARTDSAPAGSRDLADELRALATKPDAPEHADLSGTTGVRHLRIEYVRKSKRPARASAAQRRT